MVHQKSIKQHFSSGHQDVYKLPGHFTSSSRLGEFFIGAEDTIGIDAALSKVHNTYLRPDPIGSELCESYTLLYSWCYSPGN